MLASKIRINLCEMGHDSVVVVGGQRVVSGQGHHRLHHRIIVECISKDISNRRHVARNLGEPIRTMISKRVISKFWVQLLWLLK